MSSSFSGDSLVDPITSRGRDWPCLRQFIVFLENRVGSLHDLLRRVERDDLKIVALSILDSLISRLISSAEIFNLAANRKRLISISIR